LSQQAGDALEHGGLFVEVAHEEEADAEAGVLDGSDSDQEGAGTGAAGEARGLGVEEGPAVGRRRGDFASGYGGEEVAGELAEARDFYGAVAAVVGVELFVGPVAASGVLNFLAG